MSSSSSNAYSRTEIITAITEFYSLLVALPYISPDALVFPPMEGWPGVKVDDLRARGKTNEVIELLRHLPYLRPMGAGKRWMIGPDTVEIAYCEGELYEDFMDSVQPVPGHCIWLTNTESRDGTITEWTSMGHKIMVDYDEYERIPLQDRWMAHATMDATAFFKLWKRKFERLLWMPLYNSRGQAGTAQWYSTAQTKQDEEDLLESDDDFEPDSDEDGESDDGSSLSDDDDDVAEDRGYVSDEEVSGLAEDANIEEARPQTDEPQTLNTSNDEEAVNSSEPKAANRLRMDLSNLDRKTKDVYEIYTSEGWPSNFDRESCRTKLAQFLEREEPPLSQLRKPMSEQEAMAIRQRMIEKRQEKLQRRG
ncbi:MAG: hypothetical protein Q9170_005309 [Blastenia crenularia]